MERRRVADFKVLAPVSTGYGLDDRGLIQGKDQEMICSTPNLDQSLVSPSVLSYLYPGGEAGGGGGGGFFPEERLPES
jgi:hypothetical protein